MDAASAYFWVVPDTLGQIPIEVSALSGFAGDAVRRLLLVEVNKSLAVAVLGWGQGGTGPQILPRPIQISIGSVEHCFY